MKITKNSIILSNRESQAAGHHNNADCDDRAADAFGGEIRQAAHEDGRGPPEGLGEVALASSHR